MKRLATGITIAILLATQIAMAQPAVCRALNNTAAPAAGHCASEKPAASPQHSCASSAGCQELCKQNGLDLPFSPEKSGSDITPQKATAIHSSAVGRPAMSVGDAGCRFDFVVEVAQAAPPAAFLLHASLLI